MKHTLYRMFCLLLCAVLFVGMIPAVTAGATEADSPIQVMAPDENGILQVSGTALTGTLPGFKAANATKLGKPSNLEWDENNPTLLWWTVNGPLESPMLYRIHLYKDGTRVNTIRFMGEFTEGDRIGFVLSDSYEFDSGSYYCTVGAESYSGNYANGSSAKSPTWTYTKPSARYSRPTNLRWNWPIADWDSNYTDATFIVLFYYAPTKSETPWQVAGSMNPGSQWEIFNDTVKNVGPGYYYFKVRTFSDDITEKYHSAWTEMSPAYHCKDGEKLITPTAKITGNTSTGKPKVTWNAIAGAEKYRVYRATSKTGSYKLVKTTVTATSFTDTTAKAGTNYFYKVRALDTNDPITRGTSYSKYSNIVNRVCDLKRPVVDISLNEDGKPYLDWDPIDGAAKYRVYRATSKSGDYTLLKTTISATSFTDTAAKAGTTYYYKVRAIHENTNANSAYSAIDSIKAQ